MKNYLFFKDLCVGYAYLSASVISLIGWQGTPTATTLGGISPLTTLPAPITELSPITAPAKIVEPAPI